MRDKGQLGNGLNAEDAPYGYIYFRSILAPLDVTLERLRQERQEREQEADFSERNGEDIETQGTEAQEQSTEVEWPQPVSLQNCHQIVDPAQIERTAAVQQDQAHDYNDRRNAVKHLIKHLRTSGCYRAVSTASSGWRDRLENCEKLFPNFGEVFSYLRIVYALAEREESSVQLDPMLLNGPPGVGKSFFAQHLAELLQTTCNVVRMETAQSGGDIVGTSQFFGNSKPGLVFNQLVFGERGDPLIMLDELEKTSANQYDPMSPLYGLLEKESAKRFQDLAHPWLTIDASRVIWIAATNQHELLPAPILSRMKRFDIAAPTREQTQVIVEAIWQRLCREFPRATAGLTLADDARETASAYPPRIVRIALHEAIGRALYHGRDRIRAQDVAGAARVRQARPLGFV